MGYRTVHKIRRCVVPASFHGLHSHKEIFNYSYQKVIECIWQFKYDWLYAMHNILWKAWFDKII